MKLLRRLAAGFALLATAMTLTVTPLNTPTPTPSEAKAREMHIVANLTLPGLPDLSWNS